MRNNERGSALVLVMFVALLLTILGLAVLGATVGGAQRTETRENDVQSLHLAQKGLDEAVAYIQTKLDGRKDIDPDHMEDEIKNIVNEVSTKIVGVSNDVSTELSGAGGTIKSITYEKQDKQKYYVDIEAQATVNGVIRQLRQKIVIDTYPDFLKYAFGSEKVLTLNGAPGLHGNIYAGKELHISDTAVYTYKGVKGLKERTQYPRVELLKDQTIATSTEPQPEVHVQSLESIKYSGNGVIDAAVNKNNASSILPTILGIHEEQVFIKPQKKFIQINVLGSFLDKVEEATGLTGKKSELEQAIKDNQLGNYLSTTKLDRLPDENPPYTEPVLKDNPTEEEKDNYKLEYSEYLEQLRMYQNSLLDKDLNNSTIYNGNLLIDGIDYKQLKFSDEAKTGNPSNKPKWLIVNGDLEVNNYSPDITKFLEIQANILVTGNVTIKGQVKFNSTMFVLGETKVEDAVIQGLSSKELVLISQGDVLINRIDTFTNPPKKKDEQDSFYMKAFFYTDSDANLYGVGSIFWLNGGFFAKGDLTVNAVLGGVTEPLDPALGFTFENQDTDRYNSGHRFKIQYNQDVFTHQQSSLPRVQQVNVTVGPLELVSH
ncbi:hypothetical protein R50345_28450 [Paenibacillus sp. FSL R5-0345]|uniref:hypothetical protein n=1 Tax=Paenibacillus sp. FSL R5-0345 TaxID=1536770 RepID=UPI0004F8988B|nr:hypothetical protein [Paenibacillus sp. FSL R5-0345]AIQ38186.1 hypothetical protein R50345_28450 [Paenibacillus sp. FSL R5-0345]